LDKRDQRRNEVAMDLECFLNQQNITRYLKLLNVISDERQRRQIINLLEDEKLKEEELQRAKVLAADSHQL
jgi:hypothetical protein